MKTEDNLRAAMREYTDSIRPDGSAWDRIQTGMSRAHGQSWRPVAVGFLAAAAVIALVAVRMLADEHEGLRFVNPGPQSTAPSGETTPPPFHPEDLKTARLQGGWELKYPKTWRFDQLGGGDPTYPSFQLSNPEFVRDASQFSPDYFAVNGSSDAIDMNFESGPANGDWTLDEALDPSSPRSYCGGDAEEEHLVVVSCGKRTINGREWGQVVREFRAGGSATPSRLISLFTRTDAWGYSVNIDLPGAANFDPRTSIVEQIIGTFVIRTAR